MEKILIAAFDNDGVIGSDGKLPWKISEDLKHFKELTLGHPVVMGRKTWNSIGSRPLTGRDNMIITGDFTKEYTGAIAVSSLDGGLRILENSGNKKAYIIGGAQIYEQALPLVDKMEITHVYGNHKGDTYFPELNWEEWAKTKTDKFEEFEFATYERREIR